MKRLWPIAVWCIVAAGALLGGCAAPGREASKPPEEGISPAAKDAAVAAPVEAVREAPGKVKSDAPVYMALEAEPARGKASSTDAASPGPATAGFAPVGAPPAPGRPGPRGSPGVKAGFHDDNLEFGAYLDFLGRFRQNVPIPVDISNRIVVRAVDGQGKPASFATLVFRDANGGELARRATYADGRAVFSPSEYPSSVQGLKVEASWKGETVRTSVDPAGRKTVEIAFKAGGAVPARVPVDICFVLDTTGSMADEIQRLKNTLSAVHADILAAPEKPEVRFGMVLYRDRGDQYVTQKVDFTGDVERFAGSLNLVAAGGGGDEPEDLQAALAVTLQKLAWRPGAVRVAFVITDAPPHVYPDEPFTYLEAARDAAARGIKVVGIGASGLSTQGEIVLRHLAQTTMAQFVFLTYGETGDSDEAGSPARVSHHTGANFQTRDLDAIIVRFVKSELLALKGEAVREDDWMEAGPPGGGEDREVVLKKAFDGGVQRLLDFTLVPIEPKTPVALMPMEVPAAALKAAAESFESNLLLAISSSPAFKVVERGKNLRQILGEQALGLTGAVDEAQAPAVGKLVGAKLLVFSKITRGAGGFEVLVKLVRAETAEVLAVSLLKLAPELAPAETR
jgi:Mg-chelatase subunit ChlD